MASGQSTECTGRCWWPARRWSTISQSTDAPALTVWSLTTCPPSSHRSHHQTVFVLRVLFSSSKRSLSSARDFHPISALDGVGWIRSRNQEDRRWVSALCVHGQQLKVEDNRNLISRRSQNCTSWKAQVCPLINALSKVEVQPSKWEWTCFCRNLCAIW